MDPKYIFVNRIEVESVLWPNSDPCLETDHILMHAYLLQNAIFLLNFISSALKFANLFQRFL